MREKKFQRLTYRQAVILAAVLAAFSIGLFVAVCLVHSTLLRVFFVLLIVAAMSTGGVLLYQTSRESTGGGRAHGDPYRHTRGKTETSYERTFHIIYDDVADYLSDFADEPVELWQGLPVKLREQLRDDPAYRPLVAYFLCYELSGRGRPQECADIFLRAPERTVDYISRAIYDSGDSTVGSYLYRLRHRAEDAPGVSPFFIKNSEYFKDRMIGYVYKHPQKFADLLDDIRHNSRT